MHDVGKMIQRVDRSKKEKGNLKETNWHPMLGKNWLLSNKSVFKDYMDVPLAGQLILYHHENVGDGHREYSTRFAPPEIKHLALIVDKADSLSSKERLEGKESGNSPANRVVWLPSILFRKGPLEKIKQEMRYLEYFSDPFERGSVLEEKEELEVLNVELMSKFTQELSEIDRSSFDSFLRGLDAVASRYWRYFPSDIDNPLRDISLLDHSRTTAAIAAAMYKGNGFGLGVIEIDGYDEFISIEMEKALKTLRGRAKYAEQLLKDFVAQVLAIYDLPFLNEVAAFPLASWVLLSGDKGKWAQVESLRDKTNEKLLSAGQSLKIRLGHVAFGEKGFGDMSAIIEAALQDAATDSPYKNILIKCWGSPLVVLEKFDEDIKLSGKSNGVLETYPDVGYVMLRLDRTRDLILNGWSGITVEGVPVEKSISRVVGIASAIDAFFGWIAKEVLKAEKAEVVYSRGGEALFYGEWQEVFDLLERIYRQLKVYFVNGAITLSASVLVVSSNTPFWYVLNQLRKDLKKVNVKEGNKFYLSGRSISWQHLEGLLNRGKWFAELIKGKLISRGFLQNVASLAEELREGQLANLPVLFNNIGRSLTRQATEQHADQLIQWAESLIDGKAARENLWFVSWYALTATRNNVEEGVA